MHGKPKIRDCYLIHYIEKGKGTFTNEVREYNLKASDAFAFSNAFKSFLWQVAKSIQKWQPLLTAIFKFLFYDKSVNLSQKL